MNSSAAVTNTPSVPAGVVLGSAHHGDLETSDVVRRERGSGPNPDRWFPIDGAVLDTFDVIEISDPEE